MKGAIIGVTAITVDTTLYEWKTFEHLLEHGAETKYWNIKIKNQYLDNFTTCISAYLKRIQQTTFEN